MFHPASVRIRGPLQAYAEGFWADLQGQGYAAAQTKNLLLLTAHVGRWLEAEKLALRDLTEERAATFVQHRREQGYASLRSRLALEPLLRYLRGKGVVDAARPQVDNSPAGAFVQDYRGYLRAERGLEDSTIKAHCTFAKQFVASECPLLAWDCLTGREILTYVRRRSRDMSSINTCKLMLSQLRSLLRFLHIRRSIPHDLASAVPAIAGWRLSGLPKALGAGQVRELLRSFDHSPVGLRDAAVVRLLLRLGLRAAEVAALDLDDVDWRLGQIIVRGKGHHESRLPLPEDVGRAVAAYLRRGRHRASTRGLFLRTRAPHTRISMGVVCHLATTALRRAGIAAGGSHLLRRTAATELLRAGASLPEIAHVLRHRHIDTTAIYAKVDIRSLAALARPWPEVVP
jgi:integrase/recombinase XerD